MGMEFTPSERPAGPDCVDRAAYGSGSSLDQYITKQYLLAEEDYPKEACPNRYYSRAKIDDFEIINHRWLSVGIMCPSLLYTYL